MSLADYMMLGAGAAGMAPGIRQALKSSRMGRASQRLSDFMLRPQMPELDEMQFPRMQRGRVLPGTFPEVPQPVNVTPQALVDSIPTGELGVSVEAMKQKIVPKLRVMLEREMRAMQNLRGQAGPNVENASERFRLLLSALRGASDARTPEQLLDALKVAAASEGSMGPLTKKWVTQFADTPELLGDVFEQRRPRFQDPWDPGESPFLTDMDLLDNEALDDLVDARPDIFEFRHSPPEWPDMMIQRMEDMSDYHSGGGLLDEPPPLPDELLAPAHNEAIYTGPTLHRALSEDPRMGRLAGGLPGAAEHFLSRDGMLGPGPGVWENLPWHTKALGGGMGAYALSQALMGDE